METRSLVERHAYRFLAGAAVSALAIGTVVYHLVEHFSWLNAYYFSVITLTTVGYGDLTPHTAFGKLFTTFYVLSGVGIITTFVTTTIRRRGQKLRERNKTKDSS
ncbi:MAG TPA: potassium channel family protein [Candidatus Saccharimonadales bacterium]|nr:potassium channel family protein [Candidatus Saccharimonadales bacterium]